MVEIDDQIELKNGECTTLRKLVDEDRVTIWHAPFYSSGGVSAPREAFFADIYLEGQIEISAAVFDELKRLDVPIKAAP
jgi:hypothetical protein